MMVGAPLPAHLGRRARPLPVGGQLAGARRLGGRQLGGAAQLLLLLARIRFGRGARLPDARIVIEHVGGALVEAVLVAEGCLGGGQIGERDDRTGEGGRRAALAQIVDHHLGALNGAVSGLER